MLNLIEGLLYQFMFFFGSIWPVKAPLERAKTKTVLAGLAYHNQGGVNRSSFDLVDPKINQEIKSKE